MSKYKWTHPDVMMDVLLLLQKKGAQTATKEEWNYAHKIVWVSNLADTLMWKAVYITIEKSI